MRSPRNPVRFSAISEASRQGHEFLRLYDENFGRQGLPLVSELITERPKLDTEYLMGDEPQWSDLLTGRATVRGADNELLNTASSMLRGQSRDTALAVTGTAGSGKSTALMRLSIELSNQGIPVLWVDRDSSASPSSIRHRVIEAEGKIVLALDDADVYGVELTRLLKDLVRDREQFLFVFATRSAKLDYVSQALKRTGEVTLKEFAVPPLSDADIEGLVETLERHKRLGDLTGVSNTERRKAFATKCGRQLLIAMIEATSGKRFEQKAINECEDLIGVQRHVYATLCVASREGHFLTRDEIALSCSGMPGNGIEDLTTLLRRHLVVAPPPTQRYRIRHRLISELVCEYLVQQRQIKAVLLPLVSALATKVRLPGDQRDRVWRLLVRLCNHDYLMRSVDLNDGRELYVNIEGLLGADYHYWLQRGSLEVEGGDIKKAELFLRTSRSLNGDGDYRVDTEFGYMLLRKSIEDPTNPSASSWFDEGTRLLEAVIAIRGDSDSYPFHVLGSQGLAWVHRSCGTRQEIRTGLSYYKNVVEQGLRQHPLNRDLRALLKDIETELLATVIPPAGRLPEK